MVAHIFQNGDKAYIIDNVRFLREVIVLKATRDLCIIHYVDNGAVIRIRPSRLKRLSVTNRCRRSCMRLRSA